MYINDSILNCLNRKNRLLDEHINQLGVFDDSVEIQCWEKQKNPNANADYTKKLLKIN